MAIRQRKGRKPSGRPAPADTYSKEFLEELAERLSYEGANFHKLGAGDYGFVPPSSPRPSKSVCDNKRTILLNEAQSLFREGILKGMVSPIVEKGTPKYVWAVDEDGEVYEAKTKPERETVYHGYRLREDERAMREMMREEWKRRCEVN